jgi:hypothetical protein
MRNRRLSIAALAYSAIAITACAPGADPGGDEPALSADVSAISAVGATGSPTLTVTAGLCGCSP